MSASPSFAPGVARALPGIAFAVVVFREDVTPIGAHLPPVEQGSRYTRCGRFLLARLGRGTLRPLEEVCDECAAAHGRSR